MRGHFRGREGDGQEGLYLQVAASVDAPCPPCGNSKRAYVEGSTNCPGLGVLGGQIADAGARGRSSRTWWTFILTFAEVRVAGSDDVDRVEDGREVIGVTAELACASPRAALCAPADEVMGR